MFRLADNEYGLRTAVFGRDIARALNVARKEFTELRWITVQTEARHYSF